MIINHSDYCPNSTYFRTGDVAPTVEDDGSLTIYNGTGSRRSWGQPGVTSTIVLNDDDLTAVHVGFYHKHGGGQFWRYYRQGQRVLWRSLSEHERLRILDAFPTHAPRWARVPGKLRSQYVKPLPHKKLLTDEQGAILGYKWLIVGADGLYHSPTFKAAWQADELHADQPPAEDNTHGVYAAKVPNSPILRRYAAQGRALVELVLSGTVLEYDYGLRAEHAQVRRVIEQL